MNKSIVLIGLMGAGKSCVGKVLAGKMARGFVDTDDEIETDTGYAISEIFERSGERAFRDIERRVVKALLVNPNRRIFATGGGAFMDPVIRQNIKDNALSVWLRARLKTLVARTTGTTHRPLLQAGDPKKILQNLIDTRYPVYEQADLIIDTDEKTVKQTVETILSEMERMDNR